MNTTRRRFLKTSAAAGALLAAPAVITKPAFGANGPKERRDIQNMAANDPFFKDYGDAINAMHQLQNPSPSDQRNWRNQALIHINHCPHGDINFFPWHRWFILYYEQICGALIGKPDFALGYWNWSARGGIIPTPFYANGPLNVTYWNDPSNAQSDNWSPFEVTTVGTRSLVQGVGVQTLARRTFDQASIDRFKAQSNFRNFWQAIEGRPHNTGHVLVGGGNGHMGDGMSPLDPIFWLHHCNVDRIWAEWQTAGNTTPSITGRSYENNFVNASGTPQTGLSAAGSYDFLRLGYTYETLATVAPMAAALDLPTAAAALAAHPITKSEIIGSVINTAVSSSGQTTSIKVAGKGLLDKMFARRVFRATTFLSTPRNAIESGRILARFSNIKTDGNLGGTLVKVFVNAPSPTSQTPTTDPHYAGTFAFFSFGPHSHAKHSFTIDITDILHDQADDGRVSERDIELQLIPEAPDPGAAQPEFTVGKIELISS